MVAGWQGDSPPNDCGNLNHNARWIKWGNFSKLGIEKAP